MRFPTPPIGRLCRAAAVSATLLVAPAPAAGAFCPGADRIPTRAAGAARATHCVVNAARIRHGLPPLRASALLRRAGLAHAFDMVRRRYFSHSSRGGRGPVARAAARGAGRLGMRWIGENLAWATGGRATPRGVVERWLASPSHRATMLDRRLRLMGVAAVAGTPHPRHRDGFTFAAEFGG